MASPFPMVLCTFVTFTVTDTGLVAIQKALFWARRESVPGGSRVGCVQDFPGDGEGAFDVLDAVAWCGAVAADACKTSPVKEATVATVANSRLALVLTATSSQGCWLWDMGRWGASNALAAFCMLAWPGRTVR